MKENPRIYFEDEYCAVVYKKTGEHSQTFFSALFPQKTFVTAVNRLDTPVSGLVLLAFSAQAQTLFSRAFTAGEMQKEYWAICERNRRNPESKAAPETQTIPEGALFEQKAEPEGLEHFQRLEHLVGFHTKTQKAFIAGESPGAESPRRKAHQQRRLSASAKKAVLYWALCGTGERYDFIRIRPETGRTHQIRVQMAAIGRPIKGDLKYGARRSEVGGGIRLHSFKLDFTHPITGKQIVIEAEPQEPDTLWNACIEACSRATRRSGVHIR